MAECTCGYDHVHDDEHRPDCATNAPPLLVRIEFEIPPLRAVYTAWYEDFADEPESTYRRSFAENYPRGVILKIERGIPHSAKEASDGTL